MKWISVEDELPLALQPVLVWATTSLQATQAVHIKDNDYLYYSWSSGTFSTDKEENINVTHWMPLPENPNK